VGEVFNPSTFKFEKHNRKVSDVIETAGGMKKNADKKRVYIIKANGKIVTNKSIKILSSNLEPGDAVVVPQKIKYSKGFGESIKVVFETLGALTTVITLIVALKSL
jgi:protein involved in polysaccharide export with SLBB domain